MIKLVLYFIITFTISFVLFLFPFPADKVMEGKVMNENMFLLFNVMEHYKAIGLISGNFPNDDSFLLFNVMKHLRNNETGPMKYFLNDCLSNRDLFLNLLAKSSLRSIGSNDFFQACSSLRCSSLRPGLRIEQENFSTLYTNKIFNLYYQWYISHNDFYSFSTPNRGYWLDLQNINILPFLPNLKFAIEAISFEQGKELIEQLYNEVHCALYWCIDDILYRELLKSLKFSIYEADFYEEIEVYDSFIKHFDSELRWRKELTAAVYPSSFYPFKHNEHIVREFGYNTTDKDITEIARFLTYEIWGYKNRCKMHISKETLILLKSLIDKASCISIFEDRFTLLQSFFNYRNSELVNDIYTLRDFNGSSFGHVYREIYSIYDKLRFDYCIYNPSYNSSMELIKN